jgi:hypothetical protein
MLSISKKKCAIICKKNMIPTFATSTAYTASRSIIVCTQLSVFNRYGLNKEASGTICPKHPSESMNVPKLK